MSSKDLRQSIELGVKPHNGLVLARPLEQRFDHIPIPDLTYDCETIDGLVWISYYLVAMWDLLHLDKCREYV
jgi:hypothetical protein